MDIRIYALLLLLAVVGSYGEFYSYARPRRSVEGEHPLERYNLLRIRKRATDSASETTKGSDDTTTLGTTTKSSKPASTPLTTPKSTTSNQPTTSETTSKPTSAATSKPQLAERSAFEDKNDSPSKPVNSNGKPETPNNKKKPAVAARMAPQSSDMKPAAYPDPAYQPSRSFPGYNSIPPYGPNFAYTSTNHGPGGSASASAGSFASAGGFPSNPGFPSFGSRGGFYDNNPYYGPTAYGPGNGWPSDPKPSQYPTKPLTSSRSNFDTDDKPATTNTSPAGNDARPANNPNSLPPTDPQNFQSRSLGGPHSPNFDYPSVNSVQGPNYAWTNSGPGFAGAAAGASSSGIPTFGSRGAFPDTNTGVGYQDNSAYTPGNVDSGFTFYQPSFEPTFGGDPFAIHQRMMDEHFRTIQAQIAAHQQAIFEASNRGNFGQGSSDPGVHSAISSISVGPDGGFQTGQISPVAPGIESRFAEDIPAPSGGQYGVFASSQSVSMTGPDGKPISHKSATTGVNNNGKISFRTVED